VRTIFISTTFRLFDRLHHGLFKKKLFNFGIPRQVIELVMEFISDIDVSLSWGNLKTELLERGNTGVPQGSLEGMWNFGVYSDNIQDAISKAVKGITVGSEVVRAIIYADDVSPVTASPLEMNAVLKSMSRAGTFNSYKYKPSKCKVLGSGSYQQKEYTLGGKSIELAESGLLLGVVIDGRSLFTRDHVMRRAKMVGTAIKQIISWRTKGLPCLSASFSC